LQSAEDQRASAFFAGHLGMYATARKLATYLAVASFLVMLPGGEEGNDVTCL
jgi:hypothetical protein